MSVLITGGAGFIGSWLARSLLRRGESVVVVDANFETTPLRRMLSPDEAQRIVQIRADVADPVSVFRVVHEHQVDRIVHLAMISTRGEADPWEGVRVNVQGTQTIFEAARLFGVNRVVWASTDLGFGPHGPAPDQVGPIGDTGPYRPWNIYSACKALGEYLSVHYHRNFGLDLRGLRPCGTFGPGRQAGLVLYVTEMIRAAVLGQEFTVPNGEQALRMCYVEDSARAFETALYHEGPELTGRTHNIGGYPTTNREMVEMVRRALPGAKINVLPGDAGEPRTLPIDNSNFSRITGFRLQFSLEDGVRRSVEYFKQQASVTAPTA